MSGAWWLIATVVPSNGDAKVSAKKDREAACNSAASCGRKRAHGSRFQPIVRWSFIPKRAACIAAGALLVPDKRGAVQNGAPADPPPPNPAKKTVSFSDRNTARRG